MSQATGPTARSKTIVLIDAIQHDGRQYSELTLRPPKVGERRQAEVHIRNSQNPQALTEFAISLVARCGGVPEIVVNGMYDDQFGEAWEWVGSFLLGAPKHPGT